MMVRRSVTTLCVAVLALVLCGVSPAWSQTIAPGTSKAAAQGGYANLTADWWTWATGLFPETPILDEDGSLCAQGQHGKIWFLAGNFGGATTRTCTVPSGKALFFPILNTLWWAPEDADTAAALRVLANSQIEVPDVVLSVTVDGVPIEDPFGYRAQSPPEGGVYTVVAGSWADTVGISPAVRLAVADGYWVMLAPLSQGEHTVVIAASVGGGFSLEVTYQLTMGGDD